jgi:hypothetical protein
MSQPERGMKLREIPVCETKRRLIADFTAASRELIEEQDQQVVSVINEDPDFSRFDDFIHMAKGKKDKAKSALIAHVNEHRCWDAGVPVELANEEKMPIHIHNRRSRSIRTGLGFLDHANDHCGKQ